MNTFVVLEDGNIIDVYFNQPPHEIYDDVKALNKNSLNKRKYEIEQRYSSKTI